MNTIVLPNMMKTQIDFILCFSTKTIPEGSIGNCGKVTGKLYPIINPGSNSSKIMRTT